MAKCGSWLEVLKEAKDNRDYRPHWPIYLRDRLSPDADGLQVDPPVG